MVRLMVVVWVMPPPVAVMVMVRVPVVALLLAATVMVDVPAPAIEVGLKLMVVPLRCPLAERLMDEPKPPETVVVIVEWPEVPRTTVSEVGEALTVKPGVTEVTVRVTVVV